MGETEQDAADWDDWEDEGADPQPPQPPQPTERAEDGSALPGSGAGDADADWGWDIAALEANAADVEATTASLTLATAVGVSDSDAALLRLAVAAPMARESLRTDRKRAEALSALAKVARLHLLAIRSGFSRLAAAEMGIQSVASGLDGDAQAVAGELRSIAGDWAASISAWTREDSRRLDEMASALQHSLRASGDEHDLSLFEQVAEQIFASLPDRTLRVSVEWIRPVESKEEGEKERRPSIKKATSRSLDAGDSSGYLSQLLAMMTDADDSAKGADAVSDRPTRVPVLSDAEIFQDAKDIARDELAVNGEVVAGSIGYDAIVDRIQTQLEQLLTAEIGKPLTQFSMQLSDTLHRIAMEVLNASNRTESGGSAYEVLGRFLTRHDMEHVLIRPASAKAPPIQIDMDMGAYVSTEGLGGGSDVSSWCFGVRVVLTAVTWYLVCDAADPTVELYEVKTTYRNRLAFPVGLTPFHPINHMRKDGGAVDLQLTLPAPSPSGARSKWSEERERNVRNVDDAETLVTSMAFETLETREEDAGVAYDELL